MKKLKNSKKSKFNWIAGSVIAFIYLIACLIPAFYLEFNGYYSATSTDDPYLGIVCLATGWMSLFTGSELFLAWLANPLFLIALLFLFLRKKVAVYLSASALVL